MAKSPEATSAALPICRKHKAPLGLYCVEMEELACESCKEASGRKKYRFWTVQEAAQEHKVVLTISRDKLLAKVKGREKAQKIFSDMAKHLKNQARETEREIKDEFEELHRFLRKEEEARITALKEEEEQKSRAIKERIQTISKELSLTLDTIKTIEQELAAEDITFLQNYKITIDKTWRSLQDEPSQAGARNLMAKLAELMKLPGQVHDDTVKRMCTPHRDVEVITGGLIDVAKYLGNLKHRVWERMLQNVQYTPVTLDPNTAAPCLSLSEGLTTVSYCGDPPQLPDNPERLIYGVLGSQGFSSGRRHWDVVVGDNTNWAVGVATQAVSRKDRTARPGRAVDSVVLCFVNGKYKVNTMPLPLQWKLDRVRVELDWNSGNVTFSDPDRDRQFGTFDWMFTEPVFPYFYSLCQEHPLHLSPEKVSVVVRAHKKEESSVFSSMFNWYW